MNVLPLLRTHQRDAEFDVAVWIDDHDRLRRVAEFLAHHRAVRAAVLILAAPILAIPAAIWVVREAARIIDRAHEVAGEDTKPCARCVNHEADMLARASELTYQDFLGLCDLADEGFPWA